MIKKVLLAVVTVLVLAAAGVFFYLSRRQPEMAAPSSRKVEITPERVERGRYLFETVSSCWDCHSDVDETRFGTPLKAGGLGVGKVMPPEMGLPGTIVASNLTPDPETGLGNWTDGEIIRAIREGIGQGDRVLFPLMPYSEYRSMSDEDVQSLVAFLRSLPAKKNPLPKTKVNFPVDLMIKGSPKPAGSVSSPDRSNPVAYGGYLTKIGGCEFCHTPGEHGAPVMEKRFAGGQKFGGGTMVAVSFNLTPDRDTGIGTWSEQQFLDKFYQYKEYVEKGPPPLTPENFTAMPWLGLARMEPDDLKAIFAYLKTVPAVYNSVETRPGVSKK